MNLMSLTREIPAIMFVILILTIVFYSSCTQSDKFTLGEEFVESNTSLKIIDTFTVDLSTILVDSLPTSGTGVALVGGYKDSAFGSIWANSYFELGFTSFSTIEDATVFDSASFDITYSGVSYGDTTALMSISINQLTERITLDDDGSLYNKSTFNFSPEILGTKSFYPRPNSSDTIISIPVNEFGRKLFALIKNRDNAISTSDLFLDYIKGFVLTSDVAENDAIIGFKADYNHLKLKIYYHITKEINEDKTISISLDASNKQFNNIQYNFNSSELEKIISKNGEVSSSESGNKAFSQASLGLFPKIRFPTMQNIFSENRWKIISAQIIVEPVKNSYSLFPLPKELVLYESDKHNKLLSVLADDQKNALVAAFTLDKVYQENTSYTFDITTYLISELSDANFDTEHSLLIGMRSSDLKSSLERLEIEANYPSIKLRLYYLSY